MAWASLAGWSRGDQRVAVCYLDEPSLWEELGQAAPMLGRHDAVLLSPDDEGGPVEGGEALGGLAHEVGFG
jgi:hypothetical protein